MERGLAVWAIGGEHLAAATPKLAAATSRRAQVRDSASVGVWHAASIARAA